MHLTSPQVVGRRSDFSDGDRLAYALLWRSGIQVDPFQRALWNSRGFSSEKELIEKMLLRVNKIVDSWFKDGDSGTGQFTVLLIRDTDLAETPDDAELNRIDLALREGAGEKAENSDRGRIVSIGIWIHRDQDWFEIEKGEEEAEKNSKKVSTSATERQEDVEVNKQPAPIATPTTSSSSGGGSDPQKGNNYLSDLFRRWQTKFLLGKAHYELSILMTLSSHHRHGAAGALTNHVLPDADHRREPCWMVSTELAVPLYKRCGFRKVDTDTGKLEDVFGAGEGLYTMIAMWRDPKD